MKGAIETIKDNNGNTIAIIVYKDFKKEGVNFLTPDDFFQQLAFISHKAGSIIKAHSHKRIKREIYQTQEILLIKKGQIKVNLYDSEGVYLSSKILNRGDVILLAFGGHGFEVLKNVEIIEAKQGPYLGKEDKIIIKG